jgi:hypothetical protein
LKAIISVALLFVTTAAIAGDAYKAATAPQIATVQNCYFIRVLKPLPQDNGNAQPIPNAVVPNQPRIVPLQSRIRGFGGETFCSPMGQLRKAQ